MNEFEKELHSHISEISLLIHDIQNKITGTPVSKKLRQSIQSFHETLNRYKENVENTNDEASIEIVKMLGAYGSMTGQGIAETQGLSESVKSLGARIDLVGHKLRTLAEIAPATYRPLEVTNNPVETTRKIIDSKTQKKVEMLLYEQEKQHEHIRARLNEDELKITTLEKRLSELDGLATKTISSITSAYEQGKIEIEEKKQEIDSILGHAAGRAIAGDYEKSAESERNAANWLRYASLGVMFVIACVLCYSIWESTHTAFQWQNSLFRIALAFLLSAPAAYLARESTKHRVQQYQHLQTSLDLKAINPYIATLPDETQHKIKSEIASKIFSGKDLSGAAAESYPINVQELLMELMKRVEIPKK